MIEIKDTATVEKLKGTGRTFVATIKTGNQTFREITNLKHTFPFASNNKISIGETPSSFIEAEIRNCRLPLQNYELKVELYFGKILIPLGLFTVQEPGKVDGNGTQKIVAYDRMSNTSNFTYEAKGHANAGDIFAEICSQCGYSAKIDDLTAISVSDDILNGYDCRTALGYLASIVGANCIVGSDGKFKMVKYHIVDNLIEIDSLDTLDFPSNSSSVDYIFCTIDENTTIDVGTGNQGINIVNPLFSTTSEDTLQTVLNDIKSGTGNNYFASEFKQLNGDPRIEVGDTLLVQHRNILTGEIEEGYVPVMSLVREFDGGLSVSIEAYEPETEFYISQTDQIRLLSQANKNTTKRTEAVAELNEVVSNALGLYQTKVEGAGGDVKTYYHNKPTLENSTYIFTMNAGGFAFTTGENAWNGGNPIWQNGITKDGNAIFNYLFAEKISANLIEAGVLKSIIGNTEFNLNLGIIRQTEETDEYTKNIFITNGRTHIEKIYKNQDLTEISEFDCGGIMFIKEVTSTGDRLGYRQITYDSTNLTKLVLTEPLEIAYGGTGANNYIDAQKNLGLGNAAVRNIWSGSGGSLGTEDTSSGDFYVPTLNALISWNGTTVGTKSKLRYCYKGLFGDLAVKNWADTDNRYIRRYGLNEINIDSTGGCWTCDISVPGHGTYPLGDLSIWYNVTQTTSGHFEVQTAIECIGSINPDRTTRVWHRDRYNGIVPQTDRYGVWSKWTEK